ncbi:DUF4878 domain-containing protein [Chitinophaga agri]|uniref:DUF4878 domain-containing protein n=1 Tax=Chitinophaga agri TaxID=2703787 RepID=A0A6B9ZAT4_9BACT|nr:DUF4878 domain-containing protein [Chitinophaga agri]QHS59492.1 DUF4878 domain-containing protein [Chitinophaga agri]
MNNCMTSYLRILTLVIFFGTVLGSCKKSASPQEVALNFMHAIQESNFDLARDYATKESQQVIQLYSFFDARRNDSEREKIKKAGIKVIETEENGDKATVTVLNSSSQQKERLQLVKENGRWKISLTFESIIPNYLPPASAPLDSTMLPQDTAAPLPSVK